MSLTIALSANGDALSAQYTNAGATPLALAFWWCRTLRVVDERGAVVAPTDGSVLPCGAAEDWTELAPGASTTRDESLGCTQPAGQSARIGWSYELAPGTYAVTLVFEAPAAHGFTQSAPNPLAFRGRVESTTASLVVTAPAKRGFLARLFGR